MSNLFYMPVARALDDASAAPMGGAKLHFFTTGTNTPQNVYSDPDLEPGHAHSNPVVADGNGEFAKIYLDPSLPDYRVRHTTSADVQLWQFDDIPSNSVTAQEIGVALYPYSDAEQAAGLAMTDITDYSKRYGSALRYGATGDGVTDDTDACRMAMSTGLLIIEDGFEFLTQTITPDATGWQIIGEGGALRGHSSIPAGGAIICSLSGGADAVANQAILDVVYGASVVLTRAVVTGSMEHCAIRGVRFIASLSAIKGVWLTGFTRGCIIEHCLFDDFEDHDICINGSWSFSIVGNHCAGPGSTGIGIGLGQTGLGMNANGHAEVNEPYLYGNEVTNHANGIIWDFGQGGALVGNTIEGNATDGFRSASVAGASIIGNYFELNLGDNMQLGLGNNSDYFESGLICGNHFNNASGGGNHIHALSVQLCTIGPNNFSGTRTQQLFLVAAGGGSQFLKNVIWLPAVSSTYITNDAEFDLTDNQVITSNDMALNVPALNVKGALAHLGATLGVYGTSPAAQPAAVASPKTNYVGGELDTEAKIITAINAANTTLSTLLARLRAPGFIAT